MSMTGGTTGRMIGRIIGRMTRNSAGVRRRVGFSAHGLHGLSAHGLSARESRAHGLWHGGLMAYV